MNRVRLNLLFFLLASCGLGCQVPSYQLPGGFSSTYYRQLHGDYLPAPAVEPIEESETNSSQGVFYPQSFQFNPPTRSEFQQTVQLPPNPPINPRRYN